MPPRPPWTIVSVALSCALLAGACQEPDTAHLYRTAPLAPSLDEARVRSLDTLGSMLVDRGANFSVYSNRATRVELLLFDDPEGALPTRRFEMSRFGDVWNLYVEGIGLGQHYGYVAWGPNWTYDAAWYPGAITGFTDDADLDGNRFDPNKLLFDPYSIALHRDHDWAKGSCASGPDRTVSTWGAGAKSIITKSQYQWSDHEAAWQEQRQDPEWAGHRWQDQIVYEVHLKGFTGSPASAVAHPGSYRGFGEKAGYLADLGVTTVELMPVFEKPLDGGYWGYNTINFFAPELSYASQLTEPHDAIDEFKWMVDELHQQGLEVILDVVYNHTGEGGFWRSKIEQDPTDLSGNPALINFDAKEVASIYAFRGLDNAAYYLLSPDDQEFYFDQTGVGNQTRANHLPVRRMIMDSLRYWVDEMHVDGFRFDLAPALGVRDDDPTAWDVQSSVLQEIADEPTFQERNIRIIAEPWSLGQYRLGGFPGATSKPGYAYGEWNGNYRDVVRAFVNFDDQTLSSAEGPVDLGGALTGSNALFGSSGRKPWHSVNFVTSHDGFTMYDLFSYHEKRNGCSLLNPVCCENPTNPFCVKNAGEDNNRSRDWGSDSEAFKRQLIRDMFVFMMVSHGTPMLYGGDEWLRTQLGNNNAFSTSADNYANWFDWGAWQSEEPRLRMHDFVRKAIALRKAHGYAFAPAEYGGGAAFAWKDAANHDVTNWGVRHLMQHYYGTGADPQLLVLVNMEASTDVEFTLPAGVLWLRLVDTQQYFDDDAYFTSTGKDKKLSANVDLETPEAVSGTYTVKSRSIVVLKGTP
ncbi:MAG: glycosyl hydrolase [Deltaproteobacteria bacterium]|nr:glycosyl hydrolase [Deltaproteobacteria bacterium]